MKALIVATVVTGLTAGMAQAIAATAPAAPTCVSAHSIDHTTAVNPSTVLFHMKGGTVWQNNLPSACSGLTTHGFSLIGRNQQICANTKGITIPVLHRVCQLGKFAAYTGK